MELYEAIRGEKSIRRFTDQPVPEDALRRILNAARRSGSAKNLQWWEFIVLKDRGQLEAFAAIRDTCRHVAGAACAVVIVIPADQPLAMFDAGRAFQNMMLAVHAEGLGCCIGTPDPLAANAVLGVPEGKLAYQALSIGYPAEGNNRTIDGAPLSTRPIPLGRRPLDEMVYLDRYGATGR